MVFLHVMFPQFLVNLTQMTDGELMVKDEFADMLESCHQPVIL